MSNDDKARSIIQAGSEIAGAAVGGALGFISGGPVAAAGAGAVGGRNSCFGRCSQSLSI
jgi:hypothetical protein